jgi:hypothetical protein
MKMLQANVVVPAASVTVARTLPRLLGRSLRPCAHGAFRLDISRRDIAELDADPMNSMPASAARERWYPRFRGKVNLVPLSDGTDITITGAVEHGEGPIRDTHYEWSATQKALDRLTDLLRRHFAHLKKDALVQHVQINSRCL